MTGTGPMTINGEGKGMRAVWEAAAVIPAACEFLARLLERRLYRGNQPHLDETLEPPSCRKG